MNYREAREKIKLIQSQRLKELNENRCEEILKKTTSSHMDTVFVGAVSKIEEFFGVLWGENEDVDEEQMTVEQKKWFNKFLDLRDSIFDQGNLEKKKMLNDIGCFKITIKDTKIHAGQTNGKRKDI